MAYSHPYGTPLRFSCLIISYANVFCFEIRIQAIADETMWESVANLFSWWRQPDQATPACRRDVWISKFRQLTTVDAARFVHRSTEERKFVRNLAEISSFRYRRKKRYTMRHQSGSIVNNDKEYTMFRPIAFVKKSPGFIFRFRNQVRIVKSQNWHPLVTVSCKAFVLCSCSLIYC